MHQRVVFKIINHGTDDYLKAIALREAILRKPYGLIFSPEELALEKEHIQIVGMIGDEVCATTVLVPEGTTCKMQRVVVREGIQAKGIGSAMMSFSEDYARTLGFQKIYCHARDKAVNFYLKNGYIPEGDYFDEDTIPHLKMWKAL